MSSIRFNSSAGQPIKPEVLNHATASPLVQNNIQLHLGSAYLRDFTDSGIEKFIANHPEGKNLDKAEVKAFVQRLAQNPTAIAGMTFDLADTQLGLAKGDGVELRHLNGAFTLNLTEQKHLPEGTSPANIKFVDVTSVSFDVQVQEKKIAAAEKDLKGLETQLEQLRKSHADLKDEQGTAADRIGGKAQDTLKETRAKLKENDEQTAALTEDLKKYKTDLAALKENKEMPAADKAKQQTLLERAIRGAEGDLSRLQKEKTELQSKLKEKHGPILTTHYSLEDLEKLNTKVENSQARVKNLEQQVEKAKADLAALRKGETPAAKEGTAAEQPAKPAPETPAAVNQGDGDGVAPETPVAASTGPGEEAFAKMDIAQKTLALAEMNQADQSKYLGLLSADEKTQVNRRVSYHLQNLRETHSLPNTEQDQSTLQARVSQFEKLQTALAQAPTAPETPAQPPAAETPAAEVPAAEQPAAETPAPETPAAQPTAPVAAPQAPAQPAAAPPVSPGAGIGLGEVTEGLPADVLVSKGKPLTFNGTVLTLSNFSQLNIQQQFDILMKVDERQLKDTLRLVKREDRAQIRELAGAVVSKYAALQSQAIAQQQSAASASGSTGVASSVTYKNLDLSSYMTAEYAQRAQLIIQTLNEIEAEEKAGGIQGPSATGPGTPVNTPGAAAQRYTYTVKPGDNPLGIAERELGDKFRVHEIFQLNPGLELAMQQRGVQNRHAEKLDAYAEYKELILSRSPLPLDPVKQPQTPKVQAPANPSVEEVAPQPVVQPQAPVASQVVETPAPAVETAPVQPEVKAQAPASATLEEEPAAPAKPPETPVVQPTAPQRKTS
ncbi:hypothetical protein COW36_17040 [bacterium (Candidatus Blackallbacteria) CG17_big_fil_post_rev_8_21_14_2_50_48_46]|uniref:LysM domain-containing protein n=1 Tax=bacterium (Candidatus Blackallbacteria) CG17_big_fil_post_rev_8_21_14_2_50_48_46 TaxID=2014261 RepID=A0A2M7G1B4_9BACT|nr:MAG: hypothetical protein COW64_09350 [bacterium (Candidatus Blackallbacteria) CG18_big_fil_WC_8_21_14_2_50_49_26]PIW15508.1 MAG: hypothetical protein COW36_17040 [bacterium (Candidatus Blackallbacteria) CG17_big_fil_post_rev_8_21_14_2_50_48_46]PIW48592.1 MAG: hypothetical protein COW20_08805 [bacterium (Candidatus Blackallbacteria) CG13_big_fil_rev_8_21_14_2_50_49_14]